MPLVKRCRQQVCLGKRCQRQPSANHIQWRIQDFQLGGADLQRVHFSAKTYVKMKEMDPAGGVHAGSAPPDPPMIYVYEQD